MFACNMLPPRTFYTTRKDSGEERSYKWMNYEVVLLITHFYFSVQFSRSVVIDYLWPHELQHAVPPHHQLLESTKTMSIKLVMSSSHLILCRPLLLLPPILPSIRVFSTESTLRMGWTKYWSFSFNISPSNLHPGLISFRMDWLDRLAV